MSEPPNPHVPPPPEPPAPEETAASQGAAPSAAPGYWGPYGADHYAHPGYHFAGPEAAAPRPEFRSVPWQGVVATLAVIALGGVAALLFNQVLNYVVSIAQVAPFVLAALFAYAGRRHTWGIVLSFLVLALLLLLAYVATFGMVLTAAVSAAGITPGEARAAGFPPQAAGQLAAVSLWCLGSWLTALLAAIPAVRRLVARWLPMDPDSPVHAVALAFIASLAVLSFGQLAATGGHPVLLTIVKANPDSLKTSVDDLVVGMVLGLLFSAPATAVTVGWPLVRSLPQALERLGVVAPSRKQVLAALGVAIAMVVVFQGLDWGLNTLWELTRWPKTDAGAFEKLLKPLITPWGAVLIGVTAGIGEELMIRGVLQPRLGILLPNFFFTGLHAFQYGFDGLISVFCAGLVLGLLRQRTNTTCSAITHGTYDFILVFMSWFTS